MPRLERSIGPDGPILDIGVRSGPEYETYLHSVGKSSTPFWIAGLLDTGAQRTAIQRDLAEGMGLPVHDWVSLRSSVLGVESREAPVYRLRMTFGSPGTPDPPRWRLVEAVGVTVVSAGALLLVGQDLLAFCRFTYDGRRRRLLLSY